MTQAISERRCPHAIMRSLVPCESCDRLDAALARAKALTPIDRPYLDLVPTVEPEPLPPIPRAPATMPVVPRRAVDVAEILNCVAESYMVSVAALLSKDRHRGIAEGRHVACWLLRKLSGMSFPEIGRALADRDHTTVMSGVKRCEIRRDTDGGFKAFTDELVVAVRARLGTTQ